MRLRLKKDERESSDISILKIVLLLLLLHVSRRVLKKGISHATFPVHFSPDRLAINEANLKSPMRHDRSF